MLNISKNFRRQDITIGVSAESSRFKLETHGISHSSQCPNSRIREPHKLVRKNKCMVLIEHLIWVSYCVKNRPGGGELRACLQDSKSPQPRTL